MATTIIVSLIFFLNFIAWAIFLTHFNKVSSSEKITEKIRDSLDALVRDLNNNAERDIELVEDKIKELRAVAAEADRRLTILKAELERTEQAALFAKNIEQVSRSVRQVPQITEEEQPRKKTRSKTKTLSHTRSTASLTPADRYRSEQSQGNLFFSKEGVGPDEQRALFTSTSEQSEAVVQKIPVINPPEYLADIPVEPKKDFNKQVLQLYKEGYSAQEIASQLKTSVQEVRLVLEFA